MRQEKTVHGLGHRRQMRRTLTLLPNLYLMVLRIKDDGLYHTSIRWPYVRTTGSPPVLEQRPAGDCRSLQGIP